MTGKALAGAAASVLAALAADRLGDVGVILASGVVLVVAVVVLAGIRWRTANRAFDAREALRIMFGRDSRPDDESEQDVPPELIEEREPEPP